MTDKERLEEIKEAYRWTIDNSLVPRLSDSDTEWLINRVKELEEERDEWKDTAQSYYVTNQELREQNERYKQALEFYADSKNWIPQNDDVLSEITMDYGSKARQALECDDD